MEKLRFSTRIKAPRPHVYKVMLEDATYRIWTAAFSPGSYYEGDWKPGSKILFLGPDKEGSSSGMVSRIKENRPNAFVSIEHLGNVNKGVEDTTSDAAKAWSGALENYTFKDADGGTELVVDMDIEDSHKGMFLEMWPKALKALQELAEK